MATVITTVGKQWVVDKLDETVQTTGAFVAWGTGAGTAAVGDTTLFTEASEARVAPTITQPAADTIRWVATITADGATLTINAAGAVDIQDALTVDALTIDTGDITWSGSTPTITINAAETFTISNGTAADNFIYNTSTNALQLGDGTNGLTFDIDTGMTYQGSGRKTRGGKIKWQELSE